MTQLHRGMVAGCRQLDSPAFAVAFASKKGPG